MPDRLLRLPEVLQRVRLGKTTVYRMIGRGAFPEPLCLSTRGRAWSETDIDSWIASRPRRGAASGSPALLGVHPWAEELDLAGPFAPSSRLFEILSRAPNDWIELNRDVLAWALRSAPSTQEQAPRRAA